MACLSYDVLETMLKVKKEEVSLLGEGELSKVEKLATEFAQMCPPHNSEVLDVAAGSGILSILLQLKGYNNIDALDGDMKIINELKQLMLYRNYIHRTVKGVRSSGLESEVYDVVITAGGFARDAINPLDITELLRIVRPEGHLLWTMKTAEEERLSEFGLLPANLLALEKEGRISIVKRESFLDSDNQTAGEIYVVKKLVQKLPYYAKQDVTSELKTQITTILHDSTDPEKRTKFYDNWSHNYEEDAVLVGGYTGHIKCAEAFFKLELDRNVSILDVGCGTGLLGCEVSCGGYTQLDGLDASHGMLNTARTKNIFKEHIPASVHGVGSLPLNDDTYDAVLSSNAFAPGQIYPDALEEMIRILKPGGYLLFTMKDGFAKISPRFAVLDATLRDLEKDHKINLILGPVIFENFLMNEPGVFYMARKVTDRHIAYTDQQ